MHVSQSDCELRRRCACRDGSAPFQRHAGKAARTAGVLLAALLSVTTAAACGSSGSSSASSPSVSAPASGSSAAASGSAPADAAKAEAEVRANWEKFFDPSTSLTDKAAVLENGDQLMPLLQSLAKDPRAGQVKAQVTSVTFTSPTTADLTYSLSIQGSVVVPNASGKAVLVDGTWKVSHASLCALVTSGGNTALPGCS